MTDPAFFLTPKSNTQKCCIMFCDTPFSGRWYLSHIFQICPFPLISPPPKKNLEVNKYGKKYGTLLDFCWYWHWGILWGSTGKRLVILACELDSGKERRFTPETDPELPVRVAVRMSMGVPGLMEPFKYGGAGNGECWR